jgi:zinc protease
VDTELELLGASIDSSVGESATRLSFSALKETDGLALLLLRDMLTAPAFRQERVDRAKTAVMNAISRRNDDPRDILRRELRPLLFGKDSPLARQPEYATVGAITRGDVLEFYRRYYFPENVTLAISGDFDATRMKAAIDGLFGEWKAQPNAVPEFLNIAAQPALGAHLAVKREFPETYLAMASLGGDFQDKDSAALTVLAKLLGGNAQSRLEVRARDAKVPTSGISADFMPGHHRPGTFLISSSNPSTATGDTVAFILDETKKLRTTEVPEEELRAARESAVVQLALEFNTTAKKLEGIALMDYYGYPPNMLQTFQQNLLSVSRADILRVARERLDPEKSTVLAVSNVAFFNKPLDPRGGETHTIDIAIPQQQALPKQEVTASDAASVERGKELLRRAQQASGGVDKLAAISDMTLSYVYKLANGESERETEQWLRPSYLREEGVSSRLGTVIRYTDGATGWLSTGQISGALSGANLALTRGDLLRLQIPLLLSDRTPGRLVTGIDEQTVEITQGDLVTRVVFDPANGLPAQMLYDLPKENGPAVSIVEDLSDYRDVGGIKLPHAVTIWQAGAPYATGVVTEYKLNSGLKVEALQRRR